LDSRLWGYVNTAQKPVVPQQGTLKTKADKIIAILEPVYGKLATSIDRTALTATGATILAESEHLIQVAVSPPSLAALIDVPGVNFVRPPMKPYRQRVESQGLALVEAKPNHARNVRGQGVKVAIIDFGFSGANQLPSDMPDNWIILDLTSDSNTDIYRGDDVHGTAVTEIIYDTAPEAELTLLRVENMLEFENAKDFCVREGIDIVNFSAAWLASGFGDGKGLACDIVNDAADNGILWVNSAGNYANSQASELWTDPNYSGWHDFEEGGNEILELEDVKKGDTIKLILTWNDWPASFHDYDLYLYRIDDQNEVHELASSITKQSGNSPVELIEYEVTSTGRYGAAIRKSESARTSIIKLWSANHDLGNPSALVGTIGSPADARGSLSVGAIDYWSWSFNRIASYSSRGPTVDGRIKPDIVGPASVSTVSYGASGFSGTSAAAPHVAGAAALIKSANPSYTRDQLENALLSAALDIGASGKDNTFGAGKLRVPFLTITSVPTISSISPTRSKYGATVTITGQGFGTSRGTSKVVFYNAVEPRRVEYVRWTDSQIRVLVPAGSRTGNIQVVTPNGTSNSKILFISSPWIESLAPTRIKSGESITISGSNFGSRKESTDWVEFTGQRASFYASWSNSRITARIPLNARPGDVRVHTEIGNSNSIPIQVISPYILFVGPTTGKPGDVIRIQGGNFGGTRGSGYYVSFGNTRATISDYVSWGVSRIEVKIPTNAMSGEVKVVTANGESGGQNINVEAEAEELLSLPADGPLGYNPPSNNQHPRSIKFGFESARIPLALTYDVRLISNNEVELWINDRNQGALSASTDWTGWFSSISSRDVKSGENVIEFRNAYNTSRNRNFVTWEIRDVQLWKPFNAKPVSMPDGLNTTTPGILGSGYPSPFNSSVTIPFFMATSSHVQISVYNLIGQQIATLADEVFNAGVHNTFWDGKDRSGRAASSGIYLITLYTGDYQDVTKVALIR